MKAVIIGVVAVVALALVGVGAWFLMETPDPSPPFDLAQLDAIDDRAELQRPLTAEDVDAVLGFYDQVVSSDAYREWRAAYDEMNTEYATLQFIQRELNVRREREARKQLFVTYYTLLSKQSDYPTFNGQLVRVGALSSAARFLAGKHELEPTSEKIADLRPEVRTTTGSEPGEIALALIPAASLDLWRSLSVENRRGIVEFQERAERDFEGTVLALTWNTDRALILAAAQAD